MEGVNSRGDSLEPASLRAAALPDRGFLIVRGPDARPFLQGLVSNDVEKLGPATAIYAALLTPQGKYLFDFIILALDDDLLLEMEGRRVQDLMRRLMIYRLRSNVEFEDASARFSAAAVFGDGVGAAFGLPEQVGAARPIAGGVAIVDPRHVALGVRLIGEPSKLSEALVGFVSTTPEAYDDHRLALGVPDGSRDLVLERATLLESGFEELNGVDFSKGCFIGQELTARMKYRALIRKRLIPVVFKGEPPAPGSVVRAGERDAGEVRTVGDGLALALLRLDQVAKANEEGLPLMAGGVALEPRPPSWLALT